MAATKTISYAPDAWKMLNGVFCIFKNSETNLKNIKSTIKMKLCQDLNLMECRPPVQRVMIEGDATDVDSLVVRTEPNLADHPLAVGARYQESDIHLNSANYLGFMTSGVCVMGINKGTRTVVEINKSRYLRTYVIQGRFGEATNTLYEGGKTVEKSTYRHITETRLDSVLASIQASYQKLMYRTAGVEPWSQEAYELAAQGPIRPGAEVEVPLIYNLKCVEFKPPDFTIELNAINEDEMMLLRLICDLGIALKSSAHTTKLRLTRYGPFTLQHALLNKHWTCEMILNNLILCKDLTRDVTPKTATFQPAVSPGQTEMLESSN